MRTVIAGAFALAGSLLVAPSASAIAPPADWIPNTDWRVNANAAILDYDTIELTPNAGAQATVRTPSFGHPVTSSSRITFDLVMRGSATCTDTAPYVFGVTDNGRSFSNWDDSTPCANNSSAPSSENGTVSFPVNTNGTVDTLEFYAYTGGAGVYEISNVRIDGHLVLFAKRPVTAALLGRNLRSGNDRVSMSTRPEYYAAGASVIVAQVRRGPDRVLARGELNGRGKARFTLVDPRPNRARVIQVFVFSTATTTFAWTNRVRIR